MIVYAIRDCSLVKPTPERMVNKITAPAPGAAGVPMEAINARTMIINNWKIVTSYPPQPAINRVATTCMIAVPSMLMVIPSGRTKDAICLSTPSSVVVVSKLKGRVAALEEVEKPKTITLKIFLMKIYGFSLQIRLM